MSDAWDGEGVVVPLVTPFDEDGDVDEQALRRLVKWHLDRGVKALMPTALSGEGLLLDESEIVRVWEIVREEIDGRDASFLPAIIVLTTCRARRLARRAEELKASALLAAPVLPELYAGRATEELVGFYREIGEATETPIILFDYPAIIGARLDSVVLERLLNIESVAFLKASSPDAGSLQEQVREFGDRVGILCGTPSSILNCLSLGCRGWITGVLNVVPETGIELMESFRANDLERTRAAYFDTILPLARMIQSTRKPLGVMKAGLSIRGIPVSVPRAPGLPLTDQSGLRRILQKAVSS